MAFNISKDNKVISEINVTPLVDVMLVLLVIFMITAPLMLNGIDLTLPKTKEVNSVNLNTNQVVLSFTKRGDFFLGDKLINKVNLIEKINKKFLAGKTKTLFLRADYEINYGKVARLMSFLKHNNISQIALITEIDK